MKVKNSKPPLAPTPAHKSPRILIVDAHPVTRYGVRQFLAAEYPRAIFGEAANSAQADAWLGDPSWDLMILDAVLPGKSGLEWIKEVRSHKPKLPILILSTHPDELYALRALKAGAHAYLNKECAPEELIAIAKMVMAGQRYVSPTQAELMVRALHQPSPSAALNNLSLRELTAVRLYAKGQTIVAIAANLDLSPPTVAKALITARKKLSQPTKGALRRFAIEQGLDK